VQLGSQGAVSVTSMEVANNSAKTRDPDGGGAFPTGEVEVTIVKSGHVRITNETAPQGVQRHATGFKTCMTMCI
jgi:hypothetical protein